MTSLPTVHIVATGGTIAHTAEGRIDDEALVEAIPELSEHAVVRTEEYARVVSTVFAPSDMLGLARRVNALSMEDPGPFGIVITMGSNAIEEMAYFLDLTLKSAKPVVFTGSQRQLGSLGAEGGKNLLDAVRVAGSPEAAGKGVLVVVNEEIHAARDVTKTTSYRMNAWDSFDLGLLGLVDTDRISFFRESTRRHTSDTPFRLDSIDSIGELPRVDIIYSYLGADGALIDAAVEHGARGLVLAGFPSGAPARTGQHEALERAAGKGVVVVISHRGGRGRIRKHYASLPKQVEASNLTPQKARVLLLLALTIASAPEEIQELFDRH